MHHPTPMSPWLVAVGHGRAPTAVALSLASLLPAPEMSITAPRQVPPGVGISRAVTASARSR